LSENVRANIHICPEFDSDAKVKKSKPGHAF